MKGRSDVVEKMFPKKTDILASCIAFRLGCLDEPLAPRSPNVQGEKIAMNDIEAILWIETLNW